MDNPTLEPEAVRIQVAFQELVDCPRPEREAALDRVCRGDAGLRRAVTQLLELHSKATEEGFLDQPISLLSLGDMAETDDETLLPETIGRYRIIDRLGTGGLGVVYRAMSPPPAAREVAVKVLRYGASANALTRFRTEQQALASLDHPGIAKIYDCGLTEANELFAVFEFVDGCPLTTFAKQHQLSWQSRIGLLLQVCDAVQHAHNRGVIHRDLKPGNLLATRADTGTVVKVIDFGVSKLLPPEPGSSLTEHGMLVGTLAYMAPEMIAGTGASDTRVDVYGLGVTLFELLEGRHPYQECLTSLPELVRAVGRPCPRLRGPYAGSRRDLDAIVHKATNEDPEQRYATPEHMADDLRRLLDQRPVLARPPSVVDAAVKLVRRRFGITAIAAACVILVGVLVLKTIASGREASAHRAALQQTVGSLTDDVLSELAEMSGTGSVRVRFADILNQRLSELREEGADTLDIRLQHTHVLDVLSDDHLDHRRFDEADTIRRRVLDELESLLSERPDDRSLRRAHARALVRVGDVSNDRGDIDEALPWYQSAHDIIVGLAKDDPDDAGVLDDLCWSLERLAAQHWQRGREERAIELADERLKIASDLWRRHPQALPVLHNLATAHVQRGEYAYLSGDFFLSIEHAIAATTHCEQLCHADPTSFAFRMLDILAHRLWARGLVALGEDEKARPVIEKLYARSAEIEQLNPTHWWAKRVARQVRAEFPLDQ